MQGKHENRKINIWLELFLVFFVLFVIAAVLFAERYINNKKEAGDIYQVMQEEVNNIEGSEAEPEPEEKDEGEDEAEGEEEISDKLMVEIPERNLDWEALHDINPDIYAWVYVPDTAVNYPVLQHPTDNSHYLEYNIDGTKGYPGCIYSEDYNTKDFTDPHTVIYGHNMKDGTMFASLHNFEDPELVSQDHYIFIYTEEKDYAYQIFAAYRFAGIHLLANYDLGNEYVYEQYLKDTLDIDTGNPGVANVRHDIEVTKEDRILTLSTCTGDSSYRFLVTGVLLNP